jgi:hypothetical protein
MYRLYFLGRRASAKENSDDQERQASPKKQGEKQLDPFEDRGHGSISRHEHGSPFQGLSVFMVVVNDEGFAHHGANPDFSTALNFEAHRASILSI